MQKKNVTSKWMKNKMNQMIELSTDHRDLSNTTTFHMDCIKKIFETKYQLKQKRFTFIHNRFNKQVQKNKTEQTQN